MNLPLGTAGQPAPAAPLLVPATATGQVAEGFLRIGDAADCADWREQLLDLGAFWIARHREFPFFTLGATNYYDLTANPARPYAGLARQYNPLLKSCFGPLYQRVQAALAAHLGQPVEWLADHSRGDSTAALPGFHLFSAHPGFAATPDSDVTHAQWFARRDGAGFPGNPIHTDTADQALGLAGKTLSFTLPIALPASGAGLRVWPMTAADTRGLSDAACLQRLQSIAPRQVDYRLGELFVHSGNEYHQALGLPTAPGELRLTLQGHGVRRGDAWLLFW